MSAKHSTNYFNAFIEVAEDCPVQRSEEPPRKADKLTVANLQYDLIRKKPYKLTSDDLLFQVHALRKEIPKNDLASERETFFSKGQPCLRSSPLTKRYGWGVHFDARGRIALYGVESREYKKFQKDPGLEHRKAMKSKR